MAYNYSKLRGRIIEMFGTQSSFASALGLSENTLTQKLHSRKDWKQTEILRACELLEIPVAEVVSYFFVPKVQY